METVNQTLTCISSKKLVVKSPSRFFRSDIDPDREIVVFVNDSTRVYVQNFNSGRVRQLSIAHKNDINCISVSKGFVATSGLDGKCTMLSLDGDQYVPVRRDNFQQAVDCALSAEGTVLGAAFTSAESRCSEVVNIRRDTNSVISSLKVNYFVGAVDFSPDGRFTFLTEVNSVFEDKGKDYFKVYRTKDGRYRSSLEFTLGADAVSGISSDTSGDYVIATDSVSLRLWRPNQPDQTIHDLPGYIAQKRGVNEPSVSLGQCAISRDGSRAVVAIAKHCFGIWDTRRRTRIAKLMGHAATPCDVAISSNGDSIFTLDADYKLCKWKMPAKMEKPSDLEQALAAVLNDPKVLDDAFLSKHLGPEKVKTVSDLLALHNLVLLSIRMGVMTRDNLRKFGGSKCCLLDDLYLPASKLTSENTIVDVVIDHADVIGIILNGFTIKCMRDVRREVEKNMEGMSESIEDLAERVGVVEQRVDDLEFRSSALERNVGRLHSAVGKMSLNQQRLQDAVNGLSANLSQLRNALVKRDRRMQRVQIARCLLSFIPLIGKTIGETAYTATSLIMDLKAEDLLVAGVDTSKALIEGLAGVDLSNIQVVRYALSGKTLAKLEKPARNAIRKAISGSEFKSIDNLETMLTQHIHSIAKKEPAMALLDVGTSVWLTGRIEVSARSALGEARNLDENARQYFRSLIRLSTNERRELSLGDAKHELNHLFGKCDDLSKVSSTKLENLFFRLADRDAVSVNEKLFVRMFRAVRVEQQKSNMVRQMIEKNVEQFRHYSQPEMSLSLELAARLICNLRKEMAVMPMDQAIVIEELKKYDVDRSDTIEEDEFVAAVKALLHMQ